MQTVKASAHSLQPAPVSPRINLPQLTSMSNAGMPQGADKPLDPSSTSPATAGGGAPTHHARSMTLAEDSDIELMSSRTSLESGAGPSQTPPRTPDRGLPVGISESSGNAGNKPQHRRNGTNGDPDYEVPAGTLTETQVLLSQERQVSLDRFGFVVQETPSSSQAAPAQPARRSDRERMIRHIHKWRKMLGPNGANLQHYLDKKFVKVKRRVRKGIPEQVRGLAWQVLSGGRELLVANPGEFERLQRSVKPEVDASIMRDLNRTFPNHILFMQRQGPGQRSLYTVLRAYSAYDSRVGYVQGMGFITAVLLMYMSDEEAFWTLVALMKGREIGDKLEGLFLSGLPLLQCSLFQFQRLLHSVAPRVAAHFDAEGVDPALYATHWFNTVFAYSLPFEYLLRVWDVFMLEGMKVVFRVGVAILRSAEDRLLGIPFESIVELMNAKNIYSLLPPRPNDLLRMALRISVSRELGLLKTEWLSKYGQQFPIMGQDGHSGGGSSSTSAAGQQQQSPPPPQQQQQREAEVVAAK